MGIIAIPRVLREKLSDDGAEALVDVINKAEGNSREDTLKFVEEKFERRLSAETGKLRLEISEVRNEILKTRAEMIKWMFVFIFGQFWANIGVMYIFFRR